MEIHIKKEVIASLDLTKDDVEWLRSMSQNYLGPDPDGEHINDLIIREKMFSCTTEFLHEWHR